MKNREVYTYIDLHNLGSAPFWNEIRNFPQITVTADLRKCIKGVEQYDKTKGLFADDSQVQAAEIRKLTDLAVPHWTDDETKFHEMVVLTQFFRGQIHEKGDDPDIRHWLVGCRRNLNMILSAIILLEEAGIAPEDLRADGNRNIELLLDAWRYLQRNDPAIDNFHDRMNQLENRNAWNPIMNKLFGRSNIQGFVFHGFYYLTSLQERLIEAMEKSGYKIKFLFAYDERYPYANEIWRKTYSGEYGYPDQAEWKKQKAAAPEAYGEIFEGRKTAISNKVSIREYASVMEFVHEIKHIKENGYFVYSSNANTVNKILKDFYPEEYGERKILAYPIGQFVSNLNKMWDEDRQEIILAEELLIECFASGWLAVDGKAGKEYMQDLMNILPFFKDCETVDEWEKRIHLYEEIRDKVIGSFEKEWDIEDNTARWQEIMGNPFLNFSVFALKDESASVILCLIKRLLYMAKKLFSDSEKVYIKEHIRKLDQILKQHEMSNELYEEEIEIVKELFGKLSDSSAFTETCYPGDISSALNLYMSGRMQDGEIQTDRIGMVSPIYHVDAASVKHQGKIHICLCDVSNMPGGKKQYIWPLTERLIRDCYKRTRNPLIRNMQHVMESTYICNRYFMYAALKNADVQISWISNMDDKILAPSPYIKLLTEAAGIRIMPAKRSRITYQQVEKSLYGKRKTLPYDKMKMPQDTAKEAKMDYAICPMKYVFGHVVDKYPSFQNEFHQNYAINGLIAAIYSLMKGRGLGVDEIYRQVIELFPAMRKVEKRQVYDYLRSVDSFKDIDFSKLSETGEMSFTEERLKVHFPNKDVREQAFDEYGKLLTPDGKNDVDFYTTAADTETDPYKKTKVDVCLFCQHQDFCRCAVFYADQEALYD